MHDEGIMMLDANCAGDKRDEKDYLLFKEDAQVIQAVLAGDTNRFEKLVDKYGKLVFAIVAKRVPDQDVETVAQDVLLRTFRSLKKYSCKKPFQAWITTIALRSCCDFWRQQNRVRKLVVDQPSSDSIDWFEQAIENWSGTVGDLRANKNEALEILKYALGQLNPKDRMVIELTHLEGWSVKEAAEKLNWSVANVKVRAMRARMKLRKIISKLK